jgi:hypothetical protein
MVDSARLALITPDASKEEVAAIVAALAVVQESAQFDEEAPSDDLHEWVHAARLRSRRAGLQRGPWRMSGRLGRRARA